MSHTRSRWDWKGATMKGTALVATLIVVAAVGFAAGWFFHQPKGPEPTADGGHPKQATTTKVVIAMKQDHSCQQLNSAGGFAKIPPLDRVGDTITWLKGIDPNGKDTTVAVTFQQMSNGHIGTPFVDANGPKYTFGTGDNSGPPSNGAPNDAYLYDKETVGGIDCTNPKDPGVIIVN